MSSGKNRARARARADARAVRETESARRADEQRAVRERAAAERARRERRALRWRRLRLWHGAQARSPRAHQREMWAVLATVALLAIVVVYLATRSAGAVLLVALVLIIGLPALGKLSFDRRDR